MGKVCLNLLKRIEYNSNDFKWISRKVLNLIEKRKVVKNRLSHLNAQVKKKSIINNYSHITMQDIPKRLRKYWKSLKHKINNLDKQPKKLKID